MEMIRTMAAPEVAAGKDRSALRNLRPAA